MSTAEWQIGFPTGNWVATYRGLPLSLSEVTRPCRLRLAGFINGQVAESIPVTCDLEWGKKLAVDFLIDERIPEDELWSQAERRLASITFWNGVSTP